MICTLFFTSNTFISNTRLKLAKNQAKTKQHIEAELKLFENYLLSSSMLSSKNNSRYSKKCTKNKYICLNMGLWCSSMINRSHKYYITWTRPRHGHKYIKYRLCLSIMMAIKQHLSNIWSSIHEKVKQLWGWVEKSVAHKKSI